MANAYIDMTNINGVLKELYDGQKVQNMVYKDNPTLAMIRKNEEQGGKYYPVPIQNATSQGQSATFTTAQTNQSANVYNEFLVTQASYYSLATLDNRTLLSARTDKQAFINAAKAQVDGAIRTIKNTLGSSAYRAGTGSIAQIGAIAAGVITLSNKLDVVQFQINMVLQASATDGAAPRAAIGYVVAVNKAAGQITVSTSFGGAAGSPALWVANDFLLIQGNSNAMIKGLGAWIPYTAPVGGDNFFGVDRSTDVVALAGNRYDATSQSIEEGIQDALNDISTLGDGATDYLFLNPNTYTALGKSLGSKVQYVDLRSEKANVAFRGFMINGPRGIVNVLPDRWCPPKFGYALQMDTWELGSLGSAPQILTYGKEGLEVLRVANADAAELRVGYYAQLYCNAPGYNGVIKFSV